MPAISVVCDGKTVEYECVVKDSAGEVVELVDGKFLAEDLEGYTFNYTAITDFGTSNFTVNVNVIDMRVPQIKLNGYKSYTVIGEYVLPEATASMEEEVITPTVKVTDASGE